MLRAIHALEDRLTALAKADEVVKKLEHQKLKKAPGIPVFDEGRPASARH